MGEFLTRVYVSGKLENEGFPVAEVSDHLQRDDTFVWVDVSSPTKEDLRHLAEELGLHELAVEDALGSRQRPKLDRYQTHLFLSSRAVAVDVESDELRETQVDAFIDRRWIITVRDSDQFPIEPVVARCDRSPELGVHGPSHILYALLDVIVDEYFDAIEVFDDYYEQVADSIFAEHPLDPSQQRDWFGVRRMMVRFHRLVVPMREAISAIMRREHDIVPEGLYPYYQDVYDHIIRVAESSDSLRDLVNTIVETNLSLRDYRQNLVVKRVGSWAAIISVPAVITGYYGMNVPFPGSGTWVGVVVATALIVVSSIGLFLLFRRRDWL
jgi:magnesium transporter